jgi:hypothetical protein
MTSNSKLHLLYYGITQHELFNGMQYICVPFSFRLLCAFISAKSSEAFEVEIQSISNSNKQREGRRQLSYIEFDLYLHNHRNGVCEWSRSFPSPKCFPLICDTIAQRLDFPSIFLLLQERINSH